MTTTLMVLVSSLLLSAAVAHATVTLTWNAPLTGDTPTGYTMYRKVGTGTFVAIGAIVAPELTYTDPSPAVGNNTYRVTATNPAGESSPSNEVTFRVYQIPGPPTSLRIGP